MLMNVPESLTRRHAVSAIMCSQNLIHKSTTMPTTMLNLNKPTTSTTTPTLILHLKPMEMCNVPNMFQNNSNCTINVNIN